MIAASSGRYLHRTLYAIVIGTIIFAAGLKVCDSAQTNPPTNGLSIRGELTHGGLQRSYQIYIPDTLDEKSFSPMVMVFHGGFGSGKRISRRVGMNAVADKEKFIVVYPDGVDRHWNDGRSTTASGADDVSFIMAIIEKIKNEYRIDEQRIYATGLSSGGYLTQRLACESSKIIAAFAPVISTMPVPLNTHCTPEQPVPILMINGRDDPLIPWNGGNLNSGQRMGGKGGEVISVPQTVEFWRKHNRCEKSPTEITLPDNAPDDGTIVKQKKYDKCDAGTEVTLLMVVGGGHTWPGAPERPRMKKRTGNTSYDINASEVIWDFFKKYRLDQVVNK